MTIQLPKKIKITFKGSQVPYKLSALEYLKRHFNFRAVKASKDPYIFYGYVSVQYQGNHNDVIDAIADTIYIDIYIDKGVPCYIKSNASFLF